MRSLSTSNLCRSSVHFWPPIHVIPLEKCGREPHPDWSIFRSSPRSLRSCLLHQAIHLFPDVLFPPSRYPTSLAQPVVQSWRTRRIRLTDHVNLSSRITLCPAPAMVRLKEGFPVPQGHHSRRDSLCTGRCIPISDHRGHICMISSSAAASSRTRASRRHGSVRVSTAIHLSQLCM